MRVHAISTVCAGIAMLLATPAPVAAQRACGVERWRVKILADADRARVNMTPRLTSIAELRSVRAPAFLPPYDRIPPQELQVYRVRAVIDQIRGESDGDSHLVITNPTAPGETMIAEIPDSACALGSGHERDYAAVERAVFTFPKGAVVDIDGVGFFDFLHGQTGAAPNGIELHPVLAIQLVSAPSRPDSNAPAAGLRPRTTDSTASAQDAVVWLNSSSMVYHCKGTRWYGNTKRGEYLRESQALALGARPAYGRRCSRP